MFKISFFTLTFLAIIVIYLTFGNNIKNDYTLKIRENTTWNAVLDSLNTNEALKFPKAFKWMAKFYGMESKLKPGRYLLENGLSNIRILQKLANGRQDPVRVTINNITLREQLAGKISRKLDIDSVTLAEALYNPAIAMKYGFDAENFPAMFIPNTYEIFWNTDVEVFLERMKKEYDIFWNADRIAKADALGITPIQAIIVASIVQKETNYKPEYSTIAGVYLNRYKTGMALQADPTVKFANKNFALKRVSGAYLNIDSPYNTYKYAGLPPGPICLPETDVIDAVLSAEKHNYIYFCAVYGSGKHAFAATYTEHQKNAADYRKALNARNIH